MSEERIVFLKEEETDPIERDYPQGFTADDHCCWDILIVDDDPDVHDATVFALKGMLVFDRELRFHHAYSAKEALSVVAENPGIALILLDAVMETEDAGLAIVKAIRDDLGRDDVRIILRTGQPGQVPELETITRYDINDYKTKSELTRTKLMTSVIAALRSWTQIRRIGKSRRGLEKIVEASNELLQEQGLQRFADGVITQMAGLFDLEPEGIVCAMDPGTGWASSDAQPGSECCIIAAAGQYRRYINKNLGELQNREISESIFASLRNRRNIIGERSLTVFFGEASGTAFATWIASPVPLKDLDTHLLEVFCSNISICANNIALVNRLKEQAWIDPGLQMPNLPALVEKMKTILAQEGERPLTLCILDIDGFNQINEILGHEYGDEILRALVARLREFLPPETFAARVASDVFALIGAPETFSQSLLKKISLMPIQTPDGERTLSISASLTSIDSTDGNASTHLRNGFIALKRAKSEGIGQIVRYSGSIGTETRERIRLLHELKGAFAAHKLFLVFQPQYMLPERKIFCCEALLRWKNDEGEFIPPDTFIPLAEQAGLIVPMGIWILRSALAALKTIHQAGFPDMKIAVNVSAVQMRHQDFLSELDLALDETGVEPRHLELEITESISIIGIDNVLHLLNEIRSRGISLAIDDFGTGYSSLASIDKWPIHRIKIDKSFIKHLDDAEEKARLVDLLISLADRLSLNILAEGVETQSQFDRLLELGCQEIQGFLLSTPLGLEDLISLLQKGVADAC